MQKTFLEMFSKYEPSDSEITLLSGIKSYTVKADKQARIISCNVCFPCYVPFTVLSDLDR